MPVIKPTLAEWWSIHIHRKTWRDMFVNPASLDVDITELDRWYTTAGKRVPHTALLVKALALTGQAHPVINRIVFNTFYGVRILQFRQANVSLPIKYERDGQTGVRIDVVRGAADMSIAQIRAELRRLKTTLPKAALTRFLRRFSNNVLTRMVLRLAYFVVSNFPSLVEKADPGAIALSSMISLGSGQHRGRAVAWGPSPISVALCSVDRTERGVFLRLGIGYNHLACRGDEAHAALSTLADLLQGNTAEGLTPFLDPPVYQVEPAHQAAS